ncbi:MAG: hypothetical protein ABSG84_12125 [Acidobacteriaceae bacterium]|jgi:hypothetical protein
MKLRELAVGLAFLAVTASAPAQRIAVGIAPAYDAGGDDFGEVVVQHLTLYMYQDLQGGKQFAPTLLNPGGVYTPLDTSWLTDYVQDRPEIDLLLVSTLKPTVNEKGGGYTVTVELSLLDAHTGDTKSTWTVSETIKEKNAWLEKGQAMVASAVSDRSSQYGLSGLSVSSSSDFEKQPIGKITQHLAEMIRDTLPAHLGNFAAKSGPMEVAMAGPAAPCEMHTRITYNYKHSVSHSYTLLANGLDQTTTLVDGVSSFKSAEGPLLLQFSLNDTPYKLEKEPVYQLSTFHSCKSSTLVIDVGQGGDAHHHWE